MATDEKRNDLVSDSDIAMDVDFVAEGGKTKENSEDMNINENKQELPNDPVANCPSGSDDTERGSYSSAAPSAKRRMKKNDSGISVDKLSCDDISNGNESHPTEIDDDDERMCNDDASTENDLRDDETKSSWKCKVKTTETLSDKSSPDSGHHEEMATLRPRVRSSSGKSVKDNTEQTLDDEAQYQTIKSENCKELSDDDEDEPSSLRDSSSDGEDSSSYVVLKPKPNHKWFLCPEVAKRQYGISNNFSNDLFRMRANGSLHMVERLELMYKLKRHEGCVNTIHFNSSGTRLASGSDDLSVVIWDWAYGEPVLSYESGHKSNVFQVSLKIYLMKCF